jgi:preprotein translocase subunit SecF
MRLRLVKQDTKFDFFSRWKMWLGISLVMMIVGFASFMYQGLNYGIDFKGGTTIRSESTTPIDVGAYRDAISPLELGDITISDVRGRSARRHDPYPSARGPRSGQV